MQARTQDAASGRWPEILQVIGGVSPEQLTNTHQPCPSCGGNDRFRWDRDDGEGGWYCSQCGGKNHQGGAGSGLDLLMRVKGWDLKQALRQVDQHLGNPTAPHLTVVPGPAPSKKPRKPLRTPSAPPPDAPAPNLGRATAQWCYRDTSGHQLFYIQRIDSNDRKLFVHRTWLDNAWHFPSRRDDFTCQWPSPRPMYGLPQLQARPADPVLVAEGEKAAEAAARLIPSHVAVSWSGGCIRHHETDWLPLAGRTVVLWPDHDAAGRKAMADMAARLLKLGCNVTVVHLPDDFEDGWDLADADFGPERAAELLALHSYPVEVPQQQAPEPEQKSWADRNRRKLSHRRAMDCFDRCVVVQARSERNSLRRRARLIKACHDLSLQRYINRDEIAQRVLEAKDAAQGNRFQALTAADRQAMERPTVRYLVPGVMPAHDMTILGGLAKVGKTRFAVAMVAAVLRGVGMLDMPAPATTKPVVLVTDDQADGDTHDMLEALQLWHHPGLVWSRNFRLTENDIDALLATIAANPGALVVIDSLRSISRNLRHGENDPEIGATLYDLKQAVIDAGGTLLVIHHCNKAQELVGTEALSGHNAIAGAANTILTLHYLPGENGRPNKTAPERRLFREPRSGEGFDLVISRDGNGGFSKVCTLSQWQQQAQEAKDATKREQLTNTQQQVLLALQEAAGDWLTRRQVCDHLGVEWGDRGKGAEPVKVDKALRRLVVIGKVESERSGTATSYRSSCSAHRETTETTETTSDVNGSGLVSENGDNGDNGDNQSGTGCLPCLQAPETAGDNENPAGDLLSPLSALSPPPWLPELLAIRAANPRQLPGQWANTLQAQHGITADPRRIRDALEAHDSGT